MIRRYLLATLAVVASLALSGCGGAPSGGGNTPATTDAAPTAAATTAATTAAASAPGAGAQAVTIVDFTFRPQDLQAKVGETVTWTNEDTVAHTVKWDTGSPQDAPESPNLANGDTYQRTFDTAGTYPYICGIHPQMTGSVTVS